MNNMYKFNIGIMTIAGLCAAFVSCKNEDLSDVSEAKFPEKVEFVFPEEIKGLIYTDELGNSNLPLLSGETVKLGYEIYPGNVTFKDVTWTSSNESVATVSNEGEVKAIEGDGTTFSVIQLAPIAAYSGSGMYKTLKVVVSNTMVQAENVNISSESLEVYAGETLQLTASILPETSTYKTVKWTSSDESIAIVDANGLVTGVVNDKVNASVTITATTLDGSNVAGSIELIVKQIVQPQEITIDQTYSAENYLFAISDKKVELDFTTVPEECTLSLIEWKSSDETIATVENGVVTFNKNGIFGDVTITATCPETGNSSEIKLHLEEGLIRELFKDKNNITWSDAKQSGNGTSTSTEWHDGYVTVTTYKQNETKRRADFKCWEKTWLHAGKYPIIAVRMTDLKDVTGVTGRNITLDASGTCNDSKFSGGLDGNNNKWKHDYKCEDGTHVFIYDLKTQKFANGGLLPTTAIAEFTTIQFKYADIVSTDELKYNVHWVQTFKTIEDVQKFIVSEGLTYEVIK